MLVVFSARGRLIRDKRAEGAVCAAVRKHGTTLTSPRGFGRDQKKKRTAHSVVRGTSHESKEARPRPHLFLARSYIRSEARGWAETFPGKFRPRPRHHRLVGWEDERDDGGCGRQLAQPGVVAYSVIDIFFRMGCAPATPPPYPRRQFALAAPPDSRLPRDGLVLLTTFIAACYSTLFIFVPSFSSRLVSFSFGAFLTSASRFSINSKLRYSFLVHTYIAPVGPSLRNGGSSSSTIPDGCGVPP